MAIKGKEIGRKRMGDGLNCNDDWTWIQINTLYRYMKIDKRREKKRIKGGPLSAQQKLIASSLSEET